MSRGLLCVAIVALSGLMTSCLYEPDSPSASGKTECAPAATGGMPAPGGSVGIPNCDPEAPGQMAGIDPSDRSQYPGAKELDTVLQEKRDELYGTQAGDRIASLTFVDGDDQPYGLADVHKDPTRKLLLFTTSAGWCAACIEEQPTLQALHEEFHAQGLTIMVVLFEYQDYSPGDARLAQQWKRRYNLDYTVLADPTFISKPYYPNGDASATPLVMLIDVGTMTIIDVATGFNEDVVRSIIDKTL